MSATTQLDPAAEPLEIDLTMDELMEDLDPGWAVWAQRAAAVGR